MNLRFISTLLLSSLFLTATPFLLAQTPPSVPPAPINRTRPRPDTGGRDESRLGGMPGGAMHGPGSRLLPPGTWWRDAGVVSRIGLLPDQQKQIDEIFLQSRVQLIHMHATLEEEELLLEPILNGNPLDQSKALAHIGKIADTRADLEKANAKMLLSIRAVLNADQWTKLQADRHGRGRGSEGRDSGDRGGPDAQRGSKGRGALGPQ